MDTVRVARLHARYRVPAGDARAPARLDAVLGQVLDEALETALARAGVDLREEVCIRALDVPARLRLGEGDSALAAAWGAALAAGLRATVEAGGPGVVRFGSRAQALVDLLAGVARGRCGRAWAWRQLGLWNAGDQPSSAAAAEAAARALVANPELAAAAVAAAARAGALDALSGRIRPAEWTAVARAALRAASLRESAVAGLLPGAATGPEARASRAAGPIRPLPAAPAAGSSAAGSGGDADGSPGARSAPRVEAPDAADAAAARRVERVVRTSAIYPALAGAPEEARAPLAVLAALEADPTALARPSAAALVAALVYSAEGDARARGPSAGGAAARRDGEADRASPLDARRPTRRERPGPAGEGAIAHPAAAGGGASPEHAVDARPGRATPPGAPGAGEAEEDGPPAGLRQAGETRWGGLLFLLHVATDLGVPGEIVGAASFAGRPLRWVLHRLAAALLALDDADPAALAFAGLGPASDPPTRGEPPASEGEAAAVAALAGRMAAALHRRLRGAPPPDARAAAALARAICRRDARVEADPGWIDVRLAADGVDVEVRRAGLDLDPGWVPWLGVVVRFVYA